MNPWTRIARCMAFAGIACICAAAILAGLTDRPITCIVDAFVAIALAAITRHLTHRPSNREQTPIRTGGPSAPTRQDHQ